MVREFFETGNLDNQLTHTNITLIPKKKHPVYMTDLRPISLCNVVYKIISKVLANRLKQVLDWIISDTQSAFIPGRLITDNIMVAYEVMHYLKRKTRGKEGWMAMKIDMSKAYDRVEWKFLEEVLKKLGFDQRVVGLFMLCVSTASYQIAHAGKTFGEINPTRGIRQGDPLSSYLFLICMEGFTALINDFERRGLVKGIKVARNAPTISHMFFADDAYIFCKASKENAEQMLQILNLFEQASGQMINKEKSSVCFSRNTPNWVRGELCEVLGFTEADDHTTYLGLPNVVGRKKTAIFGYLKEKMQARIQGWDKKWLSKGGKEILLKTIAQALPNYSMSVFLLPVETCRDLEQMMCKYWWKTGNNRDKSIHWASWRNMCRMKSAGGLGFRNLREFNMALIGKQGWRLLIHPEKLVSKVYKARYFPNDSFLDAKIGGSPSYIWRSIMETRNMLKQGTSCRIGDGSQVNIMGDPWLPSVDDPFVHSNNEAIQGQKVSSLMCTDRL